MSKRKKYMDLIGCLLLMGLLGLFGCGSPSSASDTVVEELVEAASGEERKTAFEVDAHDETGVNGKTDTQSVTETTKIWYMRAAWNCSTRRISRWTITRAAM